MQALARWSAGMLSRGGLSTGGSLTNSTARVMLLQPLLAPRSIEPAHGAGILSMLRVRTMSTDSSSPSEEQSAAPPRVQPARSMEWPDNSIRMHDPEPAERVDALLDTLRSQNAYFEVEWTPDQAEQFRTLATNLAARANTARVVYISVYTDPTLRRNISPRETRVVSVEDGAQVQTTISQVGVPGGYTRASARVAPSDSPEVLEETLRRVSAGLEEAGVPVTFDISLCLRHSPSE